MMTYYFPSDWAARFEKRFFSYQWYGQGALLPDETSRTLVLIQRRYPLDFQQAVPIELRCQIPGPLFEWCQTEAPVWQDEDEVQQRIREIEEIAHSECLLRGAKEERRFAEKAWQRHRQPV